MVVEVKNRAEEGPAIAFRLLEALAHSTAVRDRLYMVLDMAVVDDCSMYGFKSKEGYT
jgi:hypothetical protein